MLADAFTHQNTLMIMDLDDEENKFLTLHIFVFDLILCLTHHFIYS